MSIQAAFNDFALHIEDYLTRKLMQSIEDKGEAREKGFRVCKTLVFIQRKGKLLKSKLKRRQRKEAHAAIRAQAAEALKKFQSLIKNTTTKVTKHVKITQIYHVRAVYMMRQMFKAEMPIDCVLGSSPRVPLHDCILQQAAAMHVQVIGKREFEEKEKIKREQEEKMKLEQEKMKQEQEMMEQEMMKLEQEMMKQEEN